MRKICIITSTRAEFSLLKPIILKLKKLKKKKINLILVVTGTHLSKNFGYTIKEILNSNIKVDYRINLKIIKTSSIDVARYLANGVEKFAKLLKLTKPDLLLILGDRYEIFAAAISSTIMNIPIAHIHGGEITKGAIDDVFRHSISKMAHLHFTSTNIYRKRLLQMGENQDNIFNVGSLGVENLKNMKLHGKAYLEKKLKIKFQKKILLITIHPETRSLDLNKNKIKILLTSLDKLEDTTLIFTGSNADKDGDLINQEIKKFVIKRNNIYFYESLGQKIFFSCAKISNIVIGNSSSGIIEIPSLGIPVINIGNRQEGRIYSKLVNHCEFNKQQILKTIKYIYSSKYLNKLKEYKNPYERKNTSNNILNIVTKFNLNNILNKNFYDR